MKILKLAIFLLIITFSIAFAEDLPKYRMVDLGLFGTDESRAIQVNEKGQVAGTCEQGGSNSLFLWEEINGLKIIDLPGYYGSPDGLKLNDNGQIAGVVSTGVISKERGKYSYFNSEFYCLFLWDPYLGFWEIESSKELINIAGLNDKGQILGSIGDKIFIWDYGKKINLSALFCEQVRGKWSSFQAISLNNRSEVAFNAFKVQEINNNDWGH